MILDPKRKLAGLLVPVAALRQKNDFGVGDTTAVREAIDLCSSINLTVLQLLPIHEMLGDFSPYNAVSSRALSPLLLSLTEKEVPGLDEATLKTLAPDSWLAQLREGQVKYSSIHPLKLQILFDAYDRFKKSNPAESDLGKSFLEFKKENSSWLEPYTLFRILIREYEGNLNWTEWRPEHQNFKTAEAWFTASSERTALLETRDAFSYIQWIADRQWREVRAYAEKKNVLLMGEMSFGVSRTSVDVWVYPELFDTDWNMGMPPVVYFDTNKDSERWGQNWGFPPYRWENHRATKFQWLRNRIATEKKYFHICRLDHLRGYFRAYMFPWGGGPQHVEFSKLTEAEILVKTGNRMPRYIPAPDDDPVSSKMNDLQGREIIQVIREATGDMYLFAEIMGNMPAYMKKAIEDLQLPNLTFPQLERKEDRSIPDKKSFRVLSLGSYANHDHMPISSYYEKLVTQAEKDPKSREALDLKTLMDFIEWKESPPPKMTDSLLTAFQKTLLETSCQLVMFLSSDLLGTHQRFNLPGSYGAGTWCDRLEFPMSQYAAHPVYGSRIKELQKLLKVTGRLN